MCRSDGRLWVVYAAELPIPRQRRRKRERDTAMSRVVAFAVVLVVLCLDSAWAATPLTDAQMAEVSGAACTACPALDDDYCYSMVGCFGGGYTWYAVNYTYMVYLNTVGWYGITRETKTPCYVAVTFEQEGCAGEEAFRHSAGQYMDLTGLGERCGDD